nr:hypothetical protein [Donax vittatus]
MILFSGRRLMVVCGVVLSVVAMGSWELFAMDSEAMVVSSAETATSNRHLTKFTLTNAMKEVECWSCITSSNLKVKYWVMFNNGDLAIMLNEYISTSPSTNVSIEHFRFLLKMWINQASEVSLSGAEHVISFWTFTGHSNLMFSLGMPGSSLETLKSTLYSEVPNGLVSTVSAYTSEVMMMENLKLAEGVSSSVNMLSILDPWVNLLCTINSMIPFETDSSSKKDLMDSFSNLYNSKVYHGVLKSNLKDFTYASQELKVINAARITKLWEVKGKTSAIISDTEMKKSAIKGMKQTLKYLGPKKFY